MTIFVDTSALYAVIFEDDPHHKAAKSIWFDLLTQEEELVCTNYVLVETISLMQNRLGMEPVRDFQRNAVPFLRVDWVGENEHEGAMRAFLAMGRRHLSLVDCASFSAMNRLGIQTVFAFDPHFAEQGFDCLP